MADKDAMIRDASRELERAEAAVKKARERLDLVTNLPEEPADRSVIKFTLSFTDFGRNYEYVGIRIGARWYVTGEQHHGVSYSWIELVKFIRSANLITYPFVMVRGSNTTMIAGF